MNHLVRIKNTQKADDSLIISRAKLKQTGNITEVLGMTNENHDCPIVKLNADEFLVKSTGEVKLYEHKDNRLQNIKSVRETIRSLRDIINTNVRDPVRCKWITLTYAENMTDNKRLSSDYAAFWKRFVRWCNKSGVPVPEYISVVEPQSRGAWHIHLILIWDVPAPFLDNNEVVQKLWGNGFTKTKGLNDVDNIGAYFSAYLADMPLEEVQKLEAEDIDVISSSCRVEEKEFTDERGTIKTKKFVKGARLHLYPSGMNLYRTSQKLRKPLVYEITKRQYLDIVKTYSEGKEKSQLGTLTFSSNSVVVADDGKLINSINRYYFNTNRIVLNGKDANEHCE